MAKKKLSEQPVPVDVLLLDLAGLIQWVAAQPNYMQCVDSVDRWQRQLVYSKDEEYSVCPWFDCTPMGVPYVRYVTILRPTSHASYNGERQHLVLSESGTMPCGLPLEVGLDLAAALNLGRESRKPK